MSLDWWITRLMLAMTGLGSVTCLIGFIAQIVMLRSDNPLPERTNLAAEVLGFVVLASMFVLIVFFSTGPAVQ